MTYKKLVLHSKYHVLNTTGSFTDLLILLVLAVVSLRNITKVY